MGASAAADSCSISCASSRSIRRRRSSRSTIRASRCSATSRSSSSTRATGEPYTPTGILGVFAPYGDEFQAENFSYDFDAIELLTGRKHRGRPHVPRAEPAAAGTVPRSAAGAGRGRRRHGRPAEVPGHGRDLVHAARSRPQARPASARPTRTTCSATSRATRARCSSSASGKDTPGGFSRDDVVDAIARAPRDHDERAVHRDDDRTAQGIGDDGRRAAAQRRRSRSACARRAGRRSITLIVYIEQRGRRDDRRSRRPGHRLRDDRSTSRRRADAWVVAEVDRHAEHVPGRVAGRVPAARRDGDHQRARRPASTCRRCRSRRTLKPAARAHRDAVRDHEPDLDRSSTATAGRRRKPPLPRSASRPARSRCPTCARSSTRSRRSRRDAALTRCVAIAVAICAGRPACLGSHASRRCARLWSRSSAARSRCSSATGPAAARRPTRCSRASPASRNHRCSTRCARRARAAGDGAARRSRSTASRWCPRLFAPRSASNPAARGRWSSCS